MKSQTEKAEDFRALHDRKRILVLPNAWDVPSARLFEDEGFPAVATSSAGLMVSLGYPDGEEIGIEELASAVGRIAKALTVPLSADVVAGFGTMPSQVSTSVARVIASGAVGVNLEDFVHQTKALISVEEQLSRLRALKNLQRTTGIPFVINARTDAFRFAPGEQDARLEEAIRRGVAYRDAGADCVYPMGLVDAGSIAAYVQALDFPINVMVRKGLPPVSELQRLGVARVSFGPSASYAAMGLLRRASREVLEKGTYETLTEGAITFDELNSLASPKKAEGQ
ncbi:MAG TPA: isocitrate lyase/phosphoenolpyruvate mutase family protein [Nitrososphaerales archaeon]|nr:isocitrate lyase/phosphoenolpyruvate mutase family protein [Nitrososphaerales archaeon]